MIMTITHTGFRRTGIMVCASFALTGALTACNDGDSGSSAASDGNTGNSFRDLFGNADSGDNTAAQEGEGSSEGDASGSGDTDSSAAGPEVLEPMATGDALYYEGQGRGPLAGARFTTPDRSVFCQVSGTAAVCVPTSHPEWPAGERANIAQFPDGRSDSIGWFDNLGVPYAEAPRHWQRDPQGFPAVGTGSVLDDRTKLILKTSSDGSRPDVTCGSVDNIMTCATGSHGFTVGVDTYRTW